MSDKSFRPAADWKPGPFHRYEGNGIWGFDTEAFRNAAEIGTFKPSLKARANGGISSLTLATALFHRQALASAPAQ